VANLSESQNCSDKHGPEEKLSGPLPPNREAYSVREIANALAVSEKSIYRVIARGVLKPLRAFRHHRITRKELQRFLTENM
jgi:excisionase family DNA binding protein